MFTSYCLSVDTGKQAAKLELHIYIKSESIYVYLLVSCEIIHF